MIEVDSIPRVFPTSANSLGSVGLRPCPEPLHRADRVNLPQWRAFLTTAL